LIIITSLLLSFPRSIVAQESVKNQDKKICGSSLNREIETILNQPIRQKENWGILIESTKEKQVLYQLNSHKFFIPASNTKLFPTAAILHKRGENFTINTPIYIEKKPHENSSIQTLIIEGKGDPTLSKKQLETIAQILKEKGIKEVNNVILIEGFLSSPSTNYTWEFEDIYFYFAVPVNSLILEENTVNLTLNHHKINEQPFLVWSDELAGKQWSIESQVYSRDSLAEYNITILPLFARSSLEIKGDFPLDKTATIWRLSIPNPAQYFQESLVKILNEHDIKVNKSEIIENIKDFNKIEIKKQLLLEINSPNLAELIKITNQDSNNLYAEVLLKYLADESMNQWESLDKIMTNFGVSKDDYKLKDGSGLSRHNLMTPSALVTLLQAINNSEYRETFYNSLSIASENGTLKNRFQNTNLAHNLHGKTGTLTGVASLSGYLKNQDYGDLIFAIMVNQSTDTSPNLRSSIDQIVILLGQMKKC